MLNAFMTMDKNDIYIHQLEARGIRATAIRILIFKTMLDQHQAFSLSSLEIELDTIDKSTLSRTISLFHEKLLIHSIDDGSGSIKYSVCREDCLCELKDQHMHFFCSHCKKTYCLNTISIPQIQLPQKFRLESVNFVLKGICDECS